MREWKCAVSWNELNAQKVIAIVKCWLLRIQEYKIKLFKNPVYRPMQVSVWKYINLKTLSLPLFQGFFQGWSSFCWQLRFLKNMYVAMVLDRMFKIGLWPSLSKGLSSLEVSDCTCFTILSTFAVSMWCLCCWFLLSSMSRSRMICSSWIWDHFHCLNLLLTEVKVCGVKFE